VYSGRDLQLSLPPQCSEIDVRCADGLNLALKVNSSQASHLIARKWVSGYVNKKGLLRYLILRVPKPVVVRTLYTEAPRRASDIKPATVPLMGWPTRYDRAKLGRVGGSRQYHMASRRIWEPLPGSQEPIKRRVIA
jgi:hypothetical protein